MNEDIDVVDQRMTEGRYKGCTRGRNKASDRVEVEVAGESQ